MTNSNQVQNTSAQGNIPNTGIAAENMYRMSRLFQDNCSLLPLSVNGHRVLHALLHRTCRDLPYWSSSAQQSPEGYRAKCVVLRRTLGLEAVKSNRNLQLGIADLNETDIFESIGFLHRNAWLSWRFNDSTLSFILAGDSYGLLDASALHTFRTVVDYQVFNHVSVVRRTRKPTIEITLEQIAIWTDRENARWADVSASFLDALKLSCAHYGLTAVVLLEGRGYFAGIDTVVIRLRRAGSLWTTSDLSKSSVWTQVCLLIDRTKKLRVSPAGLPDAVQRAKAVGWKLDQHEGARSGRGGPKWPVNHR